MFLEDFSFEELNTLLSNLNEKSFRAKQLFNYIHLYTPFDSMGAIPKTLRETLKKNYNNLPIEIIETKESIDGTKKFLYRLYDGNIIEGVLMRYKYGNTLCVSTQVGCRMNCAFCASGLNGLIRNLSSGEILGQVLAVNRRFGGSIDKRFITNIVLMGSGEPLDNYDNVIKFIKCVTDQNGINISRRNISLSTSGLVPNMYKLADENLDVNLTVSLHSPFDDERAKIMPIAKKYKISELLEACNYYFNKTKRRYIFEYVLLLNENDTKRHADMLISLLKGKPCHINLIRLNAVKERDLKPVADKNAYKFCEYLKDFGLSATVRRQMGSDIDGACGQLRSKYIEENL